MDGLYLFEIMIRADNGDGEMYFIFANHQHEAERALLDSFPKASGHLITTNMYDIKRGDVIKPTFGGKAKNVYRPKGRSDST